VAFSLAEGAHAFLREFYEAKGDAWDLWSKEDRAREFLCWYVVAWERSACCTALHLVQKPQNYPLRISL
jgi:hypothetical protein